MSYTQASSMAAEGAAAKYRDGVEGEAGAALAVVGLSADRAAREAALRDDMIRVAHQTGASIRQISDASGLGRKTVKAIVEAP